MSNPKLNITNTAINSAKIGAGVMQYLDKRAMRRRAEGKESYGAAFALMGAIVGAFIGPVFGFIFAIVFSIAGALLAGHINRKRMQYGFDESQ